MFIFFTFSTWNSIDFEKKNSKSEHSIRVFSIIIWWLRAQIYCYSKVSHTVSVLHRIISFAIFLPCNGVRQTFPKSRWLIFCCLNDSLRIKVFNWTEWNFRKNSEENSSIDKSSGIYWIVVKMSLSHALRISNSMLCKCYEVLTYRNAIAMQSDKAWSWLWHV